MEADQEALMNGMDKAMSDEEEEEDQKKSCPDRYEGDKFIWDLEEIEEENKNREEKEEFQYVKKI